LFTWVQYPADRYPDIWWRKKEYKLFSFQRGILIPLAQQTAISLVGKEEFGLYA